jgi:hypothetical protein
MELFNDDGTITETGRRMERELKELIVKHCAELPEILDIRTYQDIVHCAGTAGAYMIIAKRRMKEQEVER